MKKKTISVRNLNAFVANKEIDFAIQQAGEQTHERTVRLAKIILRDSPTHKLKANVPMFAFVKNAGDKLAAMVLTNGVTVLLDNSQLLSASEIHGDFSLGGVTYGVKDTVNGYPRYKVKKA